MIAWYGLHSIGWFQDWYHPAFSIAGTAAGFARIRG